MPPSCMSDTMLRLYLDACPMIRKNKPLPMRNCKKPRQELTNDDELVNSFFITEDEN